MIQVARIFWSIVLIDCICARFAMAEVPLADFARHEQYRSVKISPNGDYLAAKSVVNGQVVLELVNAADMQPRALRQREGDEFADYWWVALDRVMYTKGPQSYFGEHYLNNLRGHVQSARWDRSPTAHLDKLKAAVTLIVGGADRQVPAVQGENLHNALPLRKVEHERIYERTEGHGFYTEAHAAQTYETVPVFPDRRIGAQKVSTAVP